mgnify:CR=1 FL=1
MNGQVRGLRFGGHVFGRLRFQSKAAQDEIRHMIAHTDHAVMVLTRSTLTPVLAPSEAIEREMKKRDGATASVAQAQPLRQPVELIKLDEIREAIEPSVAQIVETIKDTIEETPPELVADIMDQGIVLAGGLEGLELLHSTSAVDWNAIFLGTAVSAVSAYLCIHFFLKLIGRAGMWPFVIYRLLLGIAIIAVL